jgi:glycine betaine/proline transport system ATP-binding protein
MRDELSALQEEIHKTIVFITHDLDEAITVGDRIAIMRDGEIIQLGRPTDIITNPVDDFVKDFTQGIPKSRVVKVSSIVTDPEVVCEDSDSIEGLIAKMDHAQCSYAITVGADTGYMGVINRKILDRMIASGNTSLDDCLDPEIFCVHPDTTLDKALPMLSEDDIPLPIVDESNTFIGVATQKDMLKLVASTT